MTPGTILDRSLVHVEGGERYEFERVSFRADTLLGEYDVSVERREEGGGIKVVREGRVFPIPLARVDSVEVVRRDLSKGLLYGAGAAVLVAFLVQVLDPDLPGEGGSDGKPGPTPP
jgi:hypothetical protein